MEPADLITVAESNIQTAEAFLRSTITPADRAAHAMRRLGRAEGLITAALRAHLTMESAARAETATRKIGDLYAEASGLLR